MQGIFDKQLQNLKDKNYPQAIILQAEKLRSKISDLDSSPVDIEAGVLPFVIVVKHAADLTYESMVEKIDFKKKKSVINMFPKVPKDFKPIESVTVPGSHVYLLVDIDRGRDSVNVTPAEALKTIVGRGRSPLTIEEGIAIMTHFPDFLIKNNCFSMLASRTGDDQRVPAFWIASDGAPRLGWCWDGNLHTWLGSASCKYRVG